MGLVESNLMEIRARRKDGERRRKKRTIGHDSMMCRKKSSIRHNLPIAIRKNEDQVIRQTTA